MDSTFTIACVLRFLNNSRAQFLPLKMRIKSLFSIGVCFAAGGKGLRRASDKAPGQWWRVGVGCTSAADGARAPDSSEPGRTWSRLGDKGP